MTTSGARKALEDAKKNGYNSEFWHADGHWDGGIGIDQSLQMGIEGWKGQGKIVERMAEKAGEYAQEMPEQEMFWDCDRLCLGYGGCQCGLPECGLNFSGDESGHTGSRDG